MNSVIDLNELGQEKDQWSEEVKRIRDLIIKHWIADLRLIAGLNLSDEEKSTAFMYILGCMLFLTPLPNHVFSDILKVTVKDIEEAEERDWLNWKHRGEKIE